MACERIIDEATSSLDLIDRRVYDPCGGLLLLKENCKKFDLI